LDNRVPLRISGHN
jgi:hypothetical protein